MKHAPPGWARASNLTPFTVFFRVKYYVENVSQLSQPLPRHLFYLQLRQDLLGIVCSYKSPLHVISFIYTEGKMFCHEDNALRLAALALQTERGRSASCAHVRVEDYVPARVSYTITCTLYTFYHCIIILQIVDKLGRDCVANVLSSMHVERHGLSRSEAELEFLKVQWPSYPHTILCATRTL